MKASEHTFTTMALDESSGNESFILALFLRSTTYRKRLVAHNKTSLLLKIFFAHVYNQIKLQTYLQTHKQWPIKNAKLKFHLLTKCWNHFLN